MVGTTRLGRVALAVLGGVVAMASARAAEVEVLHWWTSGGEARSVQELKRLLGSQGHQWKDFAVVGGGGDEALAVLRSRVQAGNPPAAAQMKRPAIQDWGRLKVLANLDEVAREQRWDVQLPKVVAESMKVDGHYVAVPVNVHRINWLWIHRDALRKVGGRVPETWDQFFALADKLQKAGVVPVAHGGQPWQDFTTFETVALGVGGADFYRRALVQLEPSALQSDTMAKVLATFRRIKAYTDPKAPGRNWNEATALVIKGQAAMQFMGDWAKGEFLAAGQQPVRDFICASAPGTSRAFIFNIDSFVMFRLKERAGTEAQNALARTIMSPVFQEAFNVSKGSIPVGTGVNLGRFDHCAQESSAYFVATSMINTLVPSVAHKMALPEKVEGAIKDVVSQFWNRDTLGIDEAMARLVQAAKAPRS
jgi:glucose/mannose transport system substrate-binding protein